MSLLDDWLSYVENPSRFNKHHFESLMLELETRKDLEAAFAGLPGGWAFIERIEQLRKDADFNGTYLLAKPREVDADAIALAEAYRDAVADRLFELGNDDASYIRKQPVKLISSDDYDAGYKAGALGLLDATMTIGDDAIDVASERPKWIRGLREAVYMMTTIPEVTRYLLGPILRYPMNDEPAARLWLMGHRIDFTKDNTLLIVGGAG
ncbi:hypothetical protein CEW89_06555 [Celeribacter ethanolicus]|uniref:Uncharacterized protein n=1 Tax=Celeribacter ethanolicus TaxID=1758178 RepID=A0A291GA23_9RHOB|nr:hypothetical protein [Celeribacter ethanolicus]ATG47259.1 hypothetical protein CEW89_06555 [Celeribacter ethanolicus]